MQSPPTGSDDAPPRDARSASQQRISEHLNSQGTQNKDLHRACTNGDVSLLILTLRKQADPNSSFYGAPAIHAACSNNHAQCVRLLLDAGADATAKNASGEGVLEMLHELPAPAAASVAGGSSSREEIVRLVTKSLTDRLLKKPTPAEKRMIHEALSAAARLRKKATQEAIAQRAAAEAAEAAAAAEAAEAEAAAAAEVEAERPENRLAAARKAKREEDHAARLARLEKSLLLSDAAMSKVINHLLREKNVLMLTTERSSLSFSIVATAVRSFRCGIAAPHLSFLFVSFKKKNGRDDDDHNERFFAATTI